MVKKETIDHQDGAFQSVSNSDLNSETIPAVSVDKAVTSEIPERNRRQSDSEGYYHRSISASGTFKINNLCYYFNQKRAGEQILIQVVENTIRVYDGQKVLLGTLDKRKGKKYSYEA